MALATTRETLWIDTPQGRLLCCRWFPVLGADPVTRPPIFLLHDSLGCIALWRDFPEQLSEATGREVIAYDRLGFGQSAPYPGSLPRNFIRDEAQRFFALVKQALQIERFVVLGHSVGGGMAAACASAHAAHCTALITVAAQAFVEDRTVQGIRAAQAQFAEPGYMARLEKYHGDKASWVLAAWTGTWLAEDFSDWTIEREIDAIHCPALVLHGEHDEYGSVCHPQRLAQLSPAGSECVILSDCQHVPHREKPDAVLEVVARFLRGRD